MRRTKGRFRALTGAFVAATVLALSACAGGVPDNLSREEEAEAKSCTNVTTRVGKPLSECDILKIGTVRAKWQDVTPETTKVIWSWKFAGHWYIAATVGPVKLMKPVSTLERAIRYSEAFRASLRGGEVKTPHTDPTKKSDGTSKWAGSSLGMTPTPREQRIHYILFNDDRERHLAWRGSIIVPGQNEMSVAFTGLDDAEAVTVTGLPGYNSWSIPDHQGFAQRHRIPLKAVLGYTYVVEVCQAAVHVKSRGVDTYALYSKNKARKAGQETWCNSLGNAWANAAGGVPHAAFASKMRKQNFKSLPGMPAKIAFSKDIYNDTRYLTR
jgi:hypothetical protein